jgi:hypothetical protein
MVFSPGYSLGQIKNSLGQIKNSLGQIKKRGQNVL